MKRSTLLLPLLALLIFSACLEDVAETTVQSYTDEDRATFQATLDLPEEVHSYAVELPEHVTALGLSPSPNNHGNPATHNRIATLGRVLFYDTKLSHNESVSCASCHDQQHGFADPVALSKGFAGEHTKRNSLALGATVSFSTAYDSNNSFLNNGSGTALFFWDERASSIAEQSRLTIEDDIEMGMDLDELSDRLNEQAYYRILFREAFGDTQVRPDRITQALDAFVDAMAATDTRFDEGLNNTGDPAADFANYSPSENLGKALFLSHCASCHGERMVTNTINLANNGLEMTYTDQGVGARTGFNQDAGKFKVPHLRNVAMTAPYMHDGRFESLAEVVDFYSEEVVNHPNLHPNLKDGDAPRRLHLSAEEKTALVDFLGTLTDHQLAADVRFSDPFKR